MTGNDAGANTVRSNDAAHRNAPTTTSAGPRPPGRAPRAWPVLVLALPAFVAIWSGWVGLGELTGFGPVRPLPGIADRFQINSAITLPIGMETYASYALYVWLSGRIRSDRTRSYAKYSAFGSLVLGAAGQIAYHLMQAANLTSAPWLVTVLVACIPVAVLGMGAALAHMILREHHQHTEVRTDQPSPTPATALTGHHTGYPAPATASMATEGGHEDTQATKGGREDTLHEDQVGLTGRGVDTGSEAADQARDTQDTLSGHTPGSEDSVTTLGADTSDTSAGDRRERAVELHRGGHTYTQIATELGVSKRTVRRYLSTIKHQDTDTVQDRTPQLALDRFETDSGPRNRHTGLRVLAGGGIPVSSPSGEQDVMDAELVDDDNSESIQQTADGGGRP